MKKLLILVCILSSLGLSAQKRLCIDAAHGYTYSGVNLDRRNPIENSTNLAVALKTHDKLKSCAGITSILTRSRWNGWISLSQRCAIANSYFCDRLLSIHCNTGGGTGTETYYYRYTNYVGRKWASDVQNKMVSWGQWVNRGTKPAGYYVLRYCRSYACANYIGFVDNLYDRRKLLSNWWRNRFANAYVAAAKTNLYVSCWTPSTPGQFTATVTADCKDGNNFNEISWTAAEGAQYYNVYRNGVLYAKTENTSYKNWSIGQDGSDFEYTVEAVCQEFKQSNTNGVVKATNNACAPVTGLKADVQTQLTLAPNPATNNVTLHISGLPETTVKVDVYNVDGRVVMSNQSDAEVSGDFETKLDVSSLAPGNYLIKCRTENQVYSEKFTKQ